MVNRTEDIWATLTAIQMQLSLFCSQTVSGHFLQEEKCDSWLLEYFPPAVIIVLTVGLVYWTRVQLESVSF